MKPDELRELAVRQYKDFFKINPYHHGVEGKINLHPVEAVGRLFNTRLFEIYDNALRQSSDINSLIQKFFREGYVRQAFFHYFISKFTQGKDFSETLEILKKEYEKKVKKLSSGFFGDELSYEELLRQQYSLDGLRGDYLNARRIAQMIINCALIDFKIIGPYKIKKIHNPKITPQKTILLDWHGTIAFGSEVRKGLEDFVSHFQSMKEQYSMVVCSATAGDEEDLEREWKGSFNAYYYIPSLSFIYEVDINTLMKENKYTSIAEIPNGKLYTDLIQKLEANERNSIIITDSFLDRNFDASFPILTLVVQRDKNQSAIEWISVIHTLESLGRATIFRSTNEYLKRIKQFDEKDSLNFYDLKFFDSQKTFRLYEIPDVKFTYFYNHKPQKWYYEKNKS